MSPYFPFYFLIAVIIGAIIGTIFPATTIHYFDYNNRILKCTTQYGWGFPPDSIVHAECANK